MLIMMELKERAESNKKSSRICSCRVYPKETHESNERLNQRMKPKHYGRKSLGPWFAKMKFFA
jgi:hypothetical protein